MSREQHRKRREGQEVVQPALSLQDHRRKAAQAERHEDPAHRVRSRWTTDPPRERRRQPPVGLGRAEDDPLPGPRSELGVGAAKPQCHREEFGSEQTHGRDIDDADRD